MTLADRSTAALFRRFGSSDQLVQQLETFLNLRLLERALNSSAHRVFLHPDIAFVPRWPSGFLATVRVLPKIRSTKRVRTSPTIRAMITVRSQ